jgi:hypothetical protein
MKSALFYSDCASNQFTGSSSLNSTQGNFSAPCNQLSSPPTSACWLNIPNPSTLQNKKITLRWYCKLTNSIGLVFLQNYTVMINMNGSQISNIPLIAGTGWNMVELPIDLSTYNSVQLFQIGIIAHPEGVALADILIDDISVY